MRRLVLVTLVSIAATALAHQDRPTPPPAAARGGGERLQKIMERVAAELNLDAQQKRKLDEIVEAQLKELGERRRKWYEMRKAEKDGDGAKADALRAEMQNAGGTNAQATIPAILDELEPHLRADQKDQMAEVHERFTRKVTGTPGELAAIESALDDLNLNDSQRARIDALLEEYRSKIANEQSRMIELAGLYKELEEARQAGDQARVDELQKRMASAQPDRRTQLGNLLDTIERTLDGDQSRTFAERRSEILAATTQRGGGPDVRTLLRAAKRLDLDENQRKQLEDIEKAADTALHELKVRDREGRLRVMNQVRREITAMLTPEQLREFERQVDRGGKREGGDKGEGGDRAAPKKRGKKSGGESATPPSP